MRTPIELVTAFFNEFSDGARLRAAFQDYMTPTTVYENVGLNTMIGPDEATALCDGPLGAENILVEMNAIAADGNKVLTERTDYILLKNGKDRGVFRVMGILEIENERIVRWRDYFDVNHLVNWYEKQNAK